MNSLIQDYPAILLSEQQSPCLSLYQPTHRHHPEKEQDPIRFSNLVKEMGESLSKQYPSRDIQALLRPFELLAKDGAFWMHTTEGLAVLSSPGLFRVYKLLRPVAELAVVADSFHIKPLMRIMQSADRYQVLGLNRQAFKVFEGNRDAMDEMPPIEGVAQAAAEKLGKDPVDREGAHRAHGPSGDAAWHGTNVKQDADNRDTEQFFRAVDQVLLEHYSQPSGLRLILAALPEHHHLFRTVSRNPFLIEEALDVDPDALSLDELRERTWQLVQPHYLERLAGFVDAFNAANASDRGADALGDIAKAAVAGRVETLLIEADRLIPGHIDATSGEMTTDDLINPEVDDVLDDLGELVLKASGEVVVVPAERMPTQTGAAAIYRF